MPDQLDQTWGQPAPQQNAVVNGDGLDPAWAGEVAPTGPAFSAGTYLGSHALNGALNLPNVPRTLEDLGLKGVDYVRHNVLGGDFGKGPDVQSEGRAFPQFDTTSWAKDHGLLTGLDMTPPSEPWKLAGTAAEFAGGGVPLGLGGKLLGAGADAATSALGGTPTGVAGSLAPKALAKGLGNDAVSNTASGAGAQLFDDSGQENLPPELRQLSGAVFGGKVARGLTNTAMSLTPGISSPNATVQAMDRLGVTPRLVGDVSGNPALQGLQKLIGELMGGGGINAAVKAGQADFANKINETADRYSSANSPSLDLESGGANVAKLAKGWINDFLGKGTGTLAMPQSQMWNALWAKMPKSDTMDLTNYKDALAKGTVQNPLAASVLGKIQSTANGLQSDLQNATTERATVYGANDYGTPTTVSSQTPPTVGQVKELHTQLGNMLGDPNLPAELNKTFLKQAYGALTQDLKAKATAIDASANPDLTALAPSAVVPGGALDAFNKARAYTAQGHQFIDNVLTSFVKDGAVPAKAMGAMLTVGNKTGQQIQALRTMLPQAADEVAATKLRTAAKIDPESPNEASPPDFARQYRAMSPGARSALFGDDQTVKDLGTWADSTSDSSRLTPGGTGQRNAGMLAASAAGALEGGRMGYEAGHLGGAALGAGAGAALPFALQHGLSGALDSPTLARMFGRTAPKLTKPDYGPAPLALSGLYAQGDK